jgi:CRP/FNR family transcriptional regulator
MEIITQHNEKINTCTVGITRCNCFHTLSAEEQNLLDRNTVEVNFAAGEIICKQGTFATHIMYVQSGLLKVYMENQNEQLILKIIPEENVAGLNSLFSGDNVFLYSIMAYVPSKVRLIDINVFRQIISSNALFAAEIIAILNANSIQTYGRFFSLTKRQSYGRLADILLCLSDRIFMSREFLLQMSRKEIAELCGMTTENVIRMLKRLKEDKVLGIEGKIFSILDYEQLKKIRDLG